MKILQKLVIIIVIANGLSILNSCYRYCGGENNYVLETIDTESYLTFYKSYNWIKTDSSKIYYRDFDSVNIEVHIIYDTISFRYSSMNDLNISTISDAMACDDVKEFYEINKKIVSLQIRTLTNIDGVAVKNENVTSLFMISHPRIDEFTNIDSSFYDALENLYLNKYNINSFSLKPSPLLIEDQRYIGFEILTYLDNNEVLKSRTEIFKIE
jgi:hypothetical protein